MTTATGLEEAAAVVTAGGGDTVDDVAAAGIAGAGVVVTTVSGEGGVIEVDDTGAVVVTEVDAMAAEPFVFAAVARAALNFCSADVRRGLGLW
jgi:hypothetical protein